MKYEWGTKQSRETFGLTRVAGVRIRRRAWSRQLL